MPNLRTYTDVEGIMHVQSQPKQFAWSDAARAAAAASRGAGGGGGSSDKGKTLTVDLGGGVKAAHGSILSLQNDGMYIHAPGKDPNSGGGRQVEGESATGKKIDIGKHVDAGTLKDLGGKDLGHHQYAYRYQVVHPDA